jgi:hypothetical protein
LLHGSTAKRNCIEEQLSKCPEAFKAGEAFEKMFNSRMLHHDDQTTLERLLPPTGAVIPPLV